MDIEDYSFWIIIFTTSEKYHYTFERNIIYRAKQKKVESL